MKKTSILTFIKNEKGSWHTAFKTDHSRQIYLSLVFVIGDMFTVEECYYLDRSTKKVPKALTISETFELGALTEKITRELDKSFSKIRFLDNHVLTREELISSYLSTEKKKILLLLKKNTQLRTIFKNKYHRAIYLDITLDGGRSYISDCHYADERSGMVPHGLTTIYFAFTLKNILQIVNDELEGGFSDVAIADEYTVALDRPICGSI